MMEECNLSGVDVLATIPPGAHACFLYERESDLVAAAAAYLGLGLARNELCVWVLPEPMSEEAAWSELDSRVPGLERHRAQGSLSIVNSTRLYAPEGEWDGDRGMARFRDLRERAAGCGYSALRVIGTPPHRSACRSPDFHNYEVASPGMSMVCAYSLETTRAAEILDAARSHRYVTAQRDERWELTTSFGAPVVEESPSELEVELRVRERTRELLELNEELLRELAGRSASERAARSRDHRLRAVFERAVVGFAVVDPRTGSCELNSTLERLLGFTTRELTGLNLREALQRLVHRDDCTRCHMLLGQLATGTQTQVALELRHLRKDGSAAWAHLRVLSIPDEAEQPGFWIATLEPAVRQRRAVREVVPIELARVNRLMELGKLATSIAHEVSQPLAAIQVQGSACVRWLMRHPPNVSEAVAAAQHILGDSQRAGDVVRWIRSLIEKAAPQRVPLDVNDLVGEVLSIARDHFQESAPSIRSDLTPELPRIFGDRIQLQLLLWNLIANAMEAMRGTLGRVRPGALSIRSRLATPQSVLVQVCDSGVGFDAATASRLFDAFYSTKPDGLGLGLAISRSIVEAHGGRLWAAPNADKPGATFQFTLPVGGEP